MHVINSLRNLEPFGIVPLTGEADKTATRILCDLTEQGRHIVIETLGLPADVQLHRNWNAGTAEDPHVASILLGRCGWQVFAVFALGEAGAARIAQLADGTVAAAMPDEVGQWEEWLEAASKSMGIPVLAIHGWTPGSTRNQHQMSGRVV